MRNAGTGKPPAQTLQRAKGLCHKNFILSEN